MSHKNNLKYAKYEPLIITHLVLITQFTLQGLKYYSIILCFIQFFA